MDRIYEGKGFECLFLLSELFFSVQIVTSQAQARLNHPEKSIVL